MTTNRVNHPRKGVEIKKHKGGRTARLNARFTETEKAAIMETAHAAGLSVSDFIVSLMARAQPTLRQPDESHTNLGAGGFE